MGRPRHLFLIVQPSTAPVSWIDMVAAAPAEANYIINSSYVSAILSIFGGDPYPGTVADCVIPAAADACP